jgi:hypothetical protein
MDLFDSPNPNAETELRLADMMRAQWETDLAEVKRRRIIPDWVGEPKPLAKDKAAFLELIHRNGRVTWTNNPSRNNKDIALAMGYKPRLKPADGFNLFDVPQEVNIVSSAKAAIASLEREGLIDANPVSDGVEYTMTTEGEYALEDWQIEQELGFV